MRIDRTKFLKSSFLSAEKDMGLISMEILKKNPASTLEQPKIPQKLPKVISLSEVEKILHSGLNELQSVIVELLYSCGLRVSELVNLKINKNGAIYEVLNDK